MIQTIRAALSLEEKAPSPNKGSVSKVDKYKWSQLNKPGEFLRIHKNELYVDWTYQRKVKTEASILAIARDWDWIACGALTVVARDDKWFVVDGQHRKLAADKRADIGELPCMVFETGTLQKEAGAFIICNTHRYSVSGYSKFHGNLAAGDELCVFVDKTVRDSGLSVGPAGSTKTVACIQTLLRLAADNREQFINMWPLFTHMHPDSEIFGDVVTGAWNVEKLWESQGNKTIMNDPWFSKLIRIGGRACAQEIRRLAIERGKGGPAVMRDAILTLLKRKI